MSGLSRTPGKRVRVNSPPRVRIPLSPPIPPMRGIFLGSSQLMNCTQLGWQTHERLTFPALPN